MDAVPFVKATAATAGAGVLRNKDGVTPHRRLLAVVFGKGGGKAISHEVFRVGADGWEPHLFYVVLVFLGQVEATAEGGSSQLSEAFLYSHITTC